MTTVQAAAAICNVNTGTLDNVKATLADFMALRHEPAGTEN